jgi:hypothetical protein
MAKTTNLYAKVEYPNYGYDSDVKAVRCLDKSRYYPVTEIDIGQSHTSFKIRGLSYHFNSVNFAFYDKDKKPVDIYSIPEYNPYLDINARKNRRKK